MNRKGISPIIASVLLLAVSISVVGIFSGWAPQLAQQVVGETENSTLSTLNCNDAGLEIRSAFYNDSANDTTVTMRNSGSENLPNVDIALYDANDLIINQSSELNYSSGELNDTSLNPVYEEPSYIEAYSTSCSSVTATLEQISQ